MKITANDISDAYKKISPFIHKTPVLTNNSINRITNSDLYFKCENFQKTGSFKARGAFNAILSVNEQKLKKGVATHSSGNHAAALAFAAQRLKIKSFIVMPKNAPVNKIEAVKSYGGLIVFCDSSLEAREATLEKVVTQTCATFIHPYNNYDIIKGQATAAYEFFNQIEKPDYILVPLGGGGLLSGTSLATKYFSPKTKVIGVEPQLADDAFRSLRDGKIYTSTYPNTIADGLRTSLKKRTFRILKENNVEILTVKEKTIAEALFLIIERMKIVVEPSAVVTLAAVLENRKRFEGKKIGLLLSGGNLDLSKIPEYRKIAGKE